MTGPVLRKLASLIPNWIQGMAGAFELTEDQGNFQLMTVTSNLSSQTLYIKHTQDGLEKEYMIKIKELNYDN